MFSEELKHYDWDETTDRIASKTDADVRRALGKSSCDIDDFMALLSPAAEPYLETMAVLSRKYTRERFGRTMSMFIPLYITNSCSNSCVYCGFHRENPMARIILTPEQIEGEWYVTLKHSMEKDHYIRFLALVTGDRCRIVRLYPEQSAEARFARRGGGRLFAFCNRHGLFEVKI